MAAEDGYSYLVCWQRNQSDPETERSGILWVSGEGDKDPKIRITTVDDHKSVVTEVILHGCTYHIPTSMDASLVYKTYMDLPSVQGEGSKSGITYSLHSLTFDKPEDKSHFQSHILSLVKVFSTVLKGLVVEAPLREILAQPEEHKKGGKKKKTSACGVPPLLAKEGKRRYSQKAEVPQVEEQAGKAHKVRNFVFE